MKKKSRGVLFIEEKLVLIKRTTERSVYYVFPGGSVEEGENFESAVIREFDEELGIRVELRGEICEILDYTGDTHEFFFAVRKVAGEVGTGLDVKFSSESVRKNEYEIVQLTITELKDLVVLPSTIKDIIIKVYGAGK